MPYDTDKTDNADEDHSPFDGYKSAVGKTEGGKQVKAEGTGLYTDTAGDKYFIKRAEESPGDDLAENITAEILYTLTGDTCAPTTLVRNKVTDEPYLASKFARGSGHKALYPQGNVAGLWTQFSKDRVYDILKENNLIPEFSRALAACMLVSEYDVHPGNFVMYTDEDGKQRVCKIDHGWGLNDIVTELDAEYNKKDPYEFKIGSGFGAYGDGYRKKPTNHFSNYPRIIFSSQFRDALEEILAKFNALDSTQVVADSLYRLEELYPDNPDKRLECLQLIAIHIGLRDFSEELAQQTFESTEERYAAAKSILTDAIAKGLQSRYTRIVKLKERITTEIASSLTSEKVKPHFKQTDQHEQLAIATAQFVNIPSECEPISKIEDYFYTTGKSDPDPNDIASFFIHYNHMLDQDMTSYILTKQENCIYLEHIFRMMPIDNVSAAQALRLVLNSGYFVIPQDPDRLDRFMQAFTRAYIESNPNCYLAQYPEEDATRYCGELLSLAASRWDRGKSQTYSDFFLHLSSSLQPKHVEHTHYYKDDFNAILQGSKIALRFARHEGVTLQATTPQHRSEIQRICDIADSGQTFDLLFNYPELPKDISITLSKPSSWSSYILGTRWTATISSSESEQVIFRINYYEPNFLSRVLGSKPTVQFVANPENSSNLDIAMNMAGRMGLSNAKVYGDNSFSAEKMQRSLLMVNEKLKISENAFLPGATNNQTKAMQPSGRKVPCKDPQNRPPRGS